MLLAEIFFFLIKKMKFLLASIIFFPPKKTFCDHVLILTVFPFCFSEV